MEWKCYKRTRAISRVRLYPVYMATQIEQSYIDKQYKEVRSNGYYFPSFLI